MCAGTAGPGKSRNPQQESEMKLWSAKLLSPKEAAGLFGIHRGTLERWVAQGKVPALKIKRHWPEPRPRRT